jgi:hypothetical protein
MRYIVPALEPLTVLHIHDEDQQPGFTRCGRPLRVYELWRTIDCRQEDRLCPECVRGPGHGEDQMLLPM